MSVSEAPYSEKKPHFVVAIVACCGLSGRASIVFVENRQWNVIFFKSAEQSGIREGLDAGMRTVDFLVVHGYYRVFDQTTP